jgi:hypothetical protein
MAEVCYYADKEYSVGSIIEVDDDEYQECISTPGGTQWSNVQERESSERGKSSLDAAGDEPDLVVKDSSDPTIVFKKGSTCSYNGEKYSVGAKLKMPNGQVKQCVYGEKGTKWVPA